MADQGRKWKAVYTIVENAASGDVPARKFWLRCGIAFPNRDGSMNIKLDALPLNGTLHVRDPLDKVIDPKGEG